MGTDSISRVYWAVSAHGVFVRLWGEVSEAVGGEIVNAWLERLQKLKEDWASCPPSRVVSGVLVKPVAMSNRGSLGFMPIWATLTPDDVEMLIEAISNRVVEKMEAKNAG